MRYDLELFEQLNEEYRERPIHQPAQLATRRQMLSPTAQNRDASTRQERVQYAARTQVKPIQADVSLKGAVALDVGCGHGFLTAALLEHGGVTSATGVDIKSYSSWVEHEDVRLDFLVADISEDPVFPPESFDVVVSQVVSKHVTRPLQMLASIYDLLKDGGIAWLRMNLHTARNASHAYREVFFPWPHLLFDDDVVAEFYRKHHGTPKRTFAWVNRMSVAHYVQVAQGMGFDIAKIHRKVSPIDVPFYLRFVDKLGRYQALDLETDFLTLVLTKGTPDVSRTADALASVNYLERQRELDAAIARYRAEANEAKPEPAAEAEASAPVD